MTDTIFQTKFSNFLSKRKFFINNPALDCAEDSTPLPCTLGTNELQKNPHVIMNLAPFERFFMEDIPSPFLENHFYQSVKKGDIFVGEISNIQESGLLVRMLALVSSIRRDLTSFKCMAFIPVREIKSRSASKTSPLDAFQVRDYVQAVILDTEFHDKTMLASFVRHDLPLGSLQVEDLPPYLNACDMRFDEYFSTISSIKNRGFLPILSQDLNLPYGDCFQSLLLSVLKLKEKYLEKASELTTTQLNNLAKQQVARGIKYFKANHNTEALQCYNNALEISMKSVDAYVARGALYASLANYKKAVEDFKKALDIDPKHENARNYFAQTLFAQGKQLVHDGKIEDGREKFRMSLTYNPQLHEAMQALKSTELNSSSVKQKRHTSSGYKRSRFDRSDSGSPFRDSKALKACFDSEKSGKPPQESSSELHWAKDALLQLMEKNDPPKKKSKNKSKRKKKSPLPKSYQNMDSSIENVTNPLPTNKTFMGDVPSTSLKSEIVHTEVEQLKPNHPPIKFQLKSPPSMANMASHSSKTVPDRLSKPVFAPSSSSGDDTRDSSKKPKNFTIDEIEDFVNQIRQKREAENKSQKRSS